MAAPEVSLKLRVRKLVQGFADKDLAEQNAAHAQQLVKQVASRSELHAILQEIFVDLEQAPPVSRKFRYRVAAVAVGSNEDLFSVPTSGLVIKYLLGFLGHEKNETTLTEMCGVVQQTTKQLLALPAHEKTASEEGGSETVVMRRVIAPLLKTGSSGAGKDRAPTACLLTEACLAECGKHTPSAEVHDTAVECLKLLLQQLTSGTLPVTVSEAYAPVRQALEVLGSGTPAALVRKVAACCLQGLKLRDNWHTRKQAAFTISALAKSVMEFEQTPALDGKHRVTPGAIELVSQKVGLQAALDGVKYDKIAQVRDAVGKAITDLSAVPDELEPPEPEPVEALKAAPPASSKDDRDKRKSRSRSLSFSKALGLNKLKGALRDVVNRPHGTDEGDSPRGDKGSSSPRKGSINKNAPLSPSPLGPSASSPRASTRAAAAVTVAAPAPSEPSPALAPAPAPAPKPSKARAGRPPFSRFRSPANSQSGSNFDVPIEVFAPSSPLPVPRDVPESIAQEEQTAGSRAFDKALEAETATFAAAAATREPSGELASQPSSGLDTAAAPTVVSGTSTASAGAAAQQQVPTAGAMPFPMGAIPFPYAAMPGFNPAAMAAMQQQYMMQMQQMQQAGMMPMPFMQMQQAGMMPQPMMMAPNGMPMQSFMMAPNGMPMQPGATVPTGAMPNVSQPMMFMPGQPMVPGMPGPADQQQQLQPLGSHSRQASGAWGPMMYGMVPTATSATDLTAAGVSGMPAPAAPEAEATAAAAAAAAAAPVAAAATSTSRPCSASSQQQALEPQGPEIPTIEHRRQGSKIPSPLRTSPLNRSDSGVTASAGASPLMRTRDPGFNQQHSPSPQGQPEEEQEEQPMPVLSEQEDAKAAAAAEAALADTEELVTTWGNPLYKFGKLNINATATSTGNAAAAAVAAESPASADLSSPDTGHYSHQQATF